MYKDIPEYANDHPIYDAPLYSETPPALTQEGRDAQLIAMAYDLVEQRMRDGTATSQEVTHFLKLATERAKLQDRILEAQAELYRAKTDAIRSESHRDELYQQVIDSIRRYGGFRNE